MNDYQKLYHEEIKKIDYDLYLKIKAMNAGIVNVSKKVKGYIFSVKVGCPS